jgi:hypothetical protein
MSLKKSASFFKSSLTSFFSFCPETWFSYKSLPENKRKKTTKTKWIGITKATKKRAMVLDEFRTADIHDLLTAIRSVKWLPAERMPMNSSTGSSGGGAFSSASNSRFLCTILG